MASRAGLRRQPCPVARPRRRGGAQSPLVRRCRRPADGRPQRRFGDDVGDRVAKILSDNGVRFLGSTTVTEIDDTHVNLDTGAILDADVVVSATGVRPDPHLGVNAGLDTYDGRIVVDEHMHTSALNVYSAGDVALAYNVTARRRIPAEHWRDAAQQGLVAGLSAAGHEAAWHKVPEFSCTIGESTL